MRVIDYVLDMSAACGGFHSIERGPEKASNGEIRRWIAQSAIYINGKPRTAPNEKLMLPVTSFILFPKSKASRTTIL